MKLFNRSYDIRGFLRLGVSISLASHVIERAAEKIHRIKNRDSRETSNEPTATQSCGVPRSPSGIGFDVRFRCNILNPGLLGFETRLIILEE